MDQLICASLSHSHYWYEVSMLKVPWKQGVIEINTGYYYAKAGGMKYIRYVKIKQNIWVKDLKKGEKGDQQMSST